MRKLAARKFTKENGGTAADNGNGNNTVPSIIRCNGRACSLRYYDILQKQQSFPVWQKKDEVLIDSPICFTSC
ncbi:hypothetical protein Nepgr_029848 [Nepenthes gracilis]|uniref:Uncharacterized protein n=1 Tax=Nepenthes gracilis TaxID=150966 RepID=A0AAD3Y598_NEPGR|nr:hypothetical protein Nepgr_029848 [Nepenthes gracilis]